MNIIKYRMAIPVILFFYLMTSGYKIINPLPLTYDPALHTEISAYIISSNFIPSSWQPLADIPFTYPPLFHWFVFIFSHLGLDAYKISIWMGLVLFSLFPVVFYLYGSAFGKIESILFSFFGAVQASLMEVFAAGEYPQLLSMNLALISLYFFQKKQFKTSGLFAGLVLLSHSFTAVYILFLLSTVFACLIKNKKVKILQILEFFSICLFVSAVWIPKYIQISDNAIHHRWENTIWYGASGFISLDKVNNIFFSMLPGSRFGLIVLLISLLGVWYSYKNKLLLPFITFLLTLVFTVFHIPSTQYKVLDMLAIATPPIASFGLIKFLDKMKRVNNTTKFLFLGFICSLLIINPYINATNLRNCCISNDTPNSDEIKVANWLKLSDNKPSFILADGKYEVWFAVIANKYPMNPRVSELEVFTSDYRQMLGDREKIIDKISNGTDASDLLAQWNINYVVVSGKSLKSASFSVVHQENATKLYKRYS